MNIRRKNRLWIACAVLAGLALTIGLVLYTRLPLIRHAVCLSSPLWYW